MTYWVSCDQWTVEVRAADGRITQAAPIVRRFIGQPLNNLLNWARGLGGLRVEMLPEPGAHHE
ncbi:MAG TPA: hypothetical protein VGG66_05605 [Rhizomicrobium sp.]|jgi:hypothetical protein